MVQEGNMSTTISNQNSESKSIESAHFFLQLALELLQHHCCHHVPCLVMQRSTFNFGSNTNYKR
jgi:hypothetical protein